MMADEFDAIAPEPIRVQFRGESIDLTPLRIGDLPAFSRLVRPAIAEFSGDRHPEWADNEDLMVADMTDLHGEAILEAAAIASGRDVEWIRGAESTGEIMGLITAIVEINRDFFYRSIRAERRSTPPAVPVEQAEQTATGQGGQTPSNTSLRPATH